MFIAVSGEIQFLTLFIMKSSIVERMRAIVMFLGDLFRDLWPTLIDTVGHQTASRGKRSRYIEYCAVTNECCWNAAGNSPPLRHDHQRRRCYPVIRVQRTVVPVHCHYCGVRWRVARLTSPLGLYGIDLRPSFDASTDTYEAITEYSLEN